MRVSLIAAAVVASLSLGAAGPSVAQTLTGPPITRVDTTTAAFVGGYDAGPINRPVVVRSFAAFVRRFGAPTIDGGEAAWLVQQFFANGGTRAWIVRVPAGPGIVPTVADLIGDEASRTGVFALRSVRFATLVLPDLRGFTEPDYQAARDAVLPLVQRRHAFLVLDPPRSLHTAADVTAWATRNAALTSDFAAVYFPAVVVVGRAVGAAGSVAGVYARIDGQLGVWKAPAGTSAAVQGVSDLDAALTDAQVDDLSVAGVNAIRAFPDTGILVWGARTFLPSTQPSDYRFVPARRLANMVERSVRRGVQWAKSEPNGPDLWGALQNQVSDFLQALWVQGAFQGVTPEDAFFVRCDASTSPGRRRAGIVYGYAFLRPGEFAIFQITVRTR